MKFESEDIRPSYSETLNVDQRKSRATLLPTRGAARLVLIAIIAGIGLSSPIGPYVLVKSGRQTDSKAAPAIDPDAMAALDKMGAYLRTLKAFQVRAEIATDDVLDDGLAIQFSSKVDLVVARPNRMRVEVTDDDGHRFFFFDGKDFTVYGQVVGYYGSRPANSRQIV
jgi:hypothetical protein